MHFLGLFKFRLDFTRNRYAEALSNYEKGMDTASLDRIQMNEAARAEHQRLCEFGIARSNIKVGNYKKGVSVFRSEFI